MGHPATRADADRRRDIAHAAGETVPRAWGTREPTGVSASRTLNGSSQGAAGPRCRAESAVRPAGAAELLHRPRRPGRGLRRLAGGQGAVAGTDPGRAPRPRRGPPYAPGWAGARTPEAPRG